MTPLDEEEHARLYHQAEQVALAAGWITEKLKPYTELSEEERAHVRLTNQKYYDELNDIAAIIRETK
jgi:hypothetical protein